MSNIQILDVDTTKKTEQIKKKSNVQLLLSRHPTRANYIFTYIKVKLCLAQPNKTKKKIIEIKNTFKLTCCIA